MLMPAYQLKTPCADEVRYLARRTLRDPHSDTIARDRAAETLAGSHDWSDMGLVQRYRETRLAIQREQAVSRAEAALSFEISAGSARPTVPPRSRWVRAVAVLPATCLALLIATSVLSAAVTTISAGSAQVAEWRTTR